MSGDEKIARNLLEVAEHDLRTANIGFEHDAPLDAVCFHLQQAAEKLVKAFLDICGIAYPYTHDLGQLLDLAVKVDTGFENFRTAFDGFASYAVAMRYDTAFYPAADEATAALETVKQFRTFVYSLLPAEFHR